MDPRLLRLFEQELTHMRGMGQEFTEVHTAEAERLGWTDLACDDPYVERLLEGFAYLTARVQLQLEEEFPRFTQHLLDLLYPNYLAPTPSMAVVQLEPDLGQAVAGHRVPRHSELRVVGHTNPRCTFLTAHEVSLWPVELVDARFEAFPPPVEGVAAQEVGAAFRLRLRSTQPFGDLDMDQLTLFLPGHGEVTGRCFETLCNYGRQVAARPAGVADAPFRVGPGAKGGAVRPLGFEDEQALLPATSSRAGAAGVRVFGGYRLLQEYFAFPERFLFVELSGLRGALAHCSEATEVELLVLLAQGRGANRLSRSLEGPVNALGADLFKLHCTPAVNLFPKNAAPVPLRDSQAEHAVIPDRSRPEGFEVHSVLGVSGGSARGGPQVEFAPLYAPRGRQGAFYTVERRPARGQSSSGRRRDYRGSDLSLALVDAHHGPFRQDFKHLNVRALCTNRGLTAQLTPSARLTCQTDGMVAGARFVEGPSRPRASAALGPMAWRLINHLTPNYTSLISEEGGSPLALRRLLELYADPQDPLAVRAVEGIKELKASRVVRPLPGEGPLCYGRGVALSLQCDERAFEGSGPFVLGAVLERFFARYAGINSFTETVLSTLQRGEIVRWPMRTGIKPAL